MVDDKVTCVHYQTQWSIVRCNVPPHIQSRIDLPTKPIRLTTMVLSESTDHHTPHTAVVDCCWLNKCLSCIQKLKSAMPETIVTRLYLWVAIISLQIKSDQSVTLYISCTGRWISLISDFMFWDGWMDLRIGLIINLNNNAAPHFVNYPTHSLLRNYPALISHHQHSILKPKNLVCTFTMDKPPEPASITTLYSQNWTTCRPKYLLHKELEFTNTHKKQQLLCRIISRGTSELWFRAWMGKVIILWGEIVLINFVVKVILASLTTVSLVSIWYEHKKIVSTNTGEKRRQHL